MGIADSMMNITENIVASYDLRMKELKDLRSDTHKTMKGFADDRRQMSEVQAKKMKGFADDRRQMSAEQAKDLAAFAMSIQKDVTAQLKGFHAEREKMSEELKESLAEFHEAHAEMSDALKKSLAKYVGDIVSGVKKLLGEYGSDMEKARKAWQGMSASLAKSEKKGAMPGIDAGDEVSTVEEAVEVKAKKKAGKKKRSKKNR